MRQTLAAIVTAALVACAPKASGPKPAMGPADQETARYGGDLSYSPFVLPPRNSFLVAGVYQADIVLNTAHCLAVEQSLSAQDNKGYVRPSLRRLLVQDGQLADDDYFATLSIQSHGAASITYFARDTGGERVATIDEQRRLQRMGISIEVNTDRCFVVSQPTRKELQQGWNPDGYGAGSVFPRLGQPVQDCFIDRGPAPGTGEMYSRMFCAEDLMGAGAQR